MKKLNYILFEDDDSEEKIGFNRYNSPGFIDSEKWTDEEHQEYSMVLEFLDPALGHNCNTYTYEIWDSEQLIKRLNLLKLQEQEPAWL